MQCMARTAAERTSGCRRARIHLFSVIFLDKRGQRVHLNDDMGVKLIVVVEYEFSRLVSPGLPHGLEKGGGSDHCLFAEVGDESADSRNIDDHCF